MTGVLRKVAELSDDNRAVVVSAGAIPPLVKFLLSGSVTPQLRVEACATLTHLARGHEETQATVAAAGGWLRFRQADRAIRAGHDLPAGTTVHLMALAVLVVVVAAGISVVV